MATLHPIAVIDRVIDEYRSYLRTEFRARDEKLRRSLEEGLDRARFLAQESFFQAYRPFKSGERWTDLRLDPRLVAVMQKRSGSKTAYLHQSESIRHLLDEGGGPLAVTTGTGSGKTECFLLPVIQNAIEDATAFKQPGLTAILVYPMNALANDQEQRIREYLEESGHTYVRVSRYDRSTLQKERGDLRANPPHILLTNYVMLEHLLVRPADREALFKDHRCRFIVLDEVHSYRGSLGANIALLCRRLRAHLRRAEQSWQAQDESDSRRYPRLRFVATSATIKSVDETERTQEEVTRLRREAVQQFVQSITGEPASSIRVIGEERVRLLPAKHATWAAQPPELPVPDPADGEAVRKVLAALAGMPETTSLVEALPRARILWVLGDLLSQRPRSAADIAERIQNEVAERRETDLAAIRHEVDLALSVGACLADTDGALRLRVHRFIRGGWRFHRCTDPECGALYPMGEGSCRCGKATAPLLLCRSCGADALHMAGEEDEPEELKPYGAPSGAQEWVLYDARRHAISADDEDEGAAATTRPKQSGRKQAKKLKGKKVLEGSFDPGLCSFSLDPSAHRVVVALAPARNRCLVCGGSGGARSIMTSVAMGTSAALRVLAEGVVEGLSREHQRLGEAQRKERVLIFADSRQDAAHQARFITYAGRYDRMRRRVVRALEDEGPRATLDTVMRALVMQGLELQDNPHLRGKRVQTQAHLPRQVQERALAWEEAPLLDDLAVTANYRGTLFNLGLVGVRYGQLADYVADAGAKLASSLGLSAGQLTYLCRCLLDAMRVHGALSRPLLAYHPASPECPEHLRASAEWERTLSRPQGYPCDEDGRIVGSLDKSEIPEGTSLNNIWRRSNRGRPPRLQAMFGHLVQRMRHGGDELEQHHLLGLMEFLRDGDLVAANKLFGFKKSRALLQVNAEAIELELVAAEERRRCSVCNVRAPWAEPGSPCPACHGVMEAWPSQEIEQNRYVERIRSNNLMPLKAGEHTAQVTGEDRMDLEERFKNDQDPLNVLACSPTLEMGIDVGGLDAVLMRNVPPRPDNYAQRGGRAGRRSRVGVVLGYARSTPHDQYFYDKPAEMIAGEVAAPAVGLGNRDVVLRHLNAIAMGSAEPGLAGRMGEYLTLKGEVLAEPVEELIHAFEHRFEYAADLALEAWGPPILGPAGLDTKERLLAVLGEQPARIRDLFERVGHQLAELQLRVHNWSELGVGKWQAMNAMDLSRRLLGLPPSDKDRRADADDRSSGHPMRRFAEFGLLPGYEFPSEPATLRLLRDDHEEEPIAVARRFGLSQYQPEAWAHARGHRWRVVGLDTASPWNPRTDEPQWYYRVCRGCALRFDALAHVRCPRCKSEGGREHPGFEFGGFVATRDDAPVLDEEDRFSRAGLLRCYPQWDGEVVERYELPTGWFVELRKGEQIRWLNEWKAPSKAELESGCVLHEEGRGFYLCPSCGRILRPPAEEAASATQGSKKAKKRQGEDAYGHGSDCRRLGERPKPLAITTASPACTLRLLVNLPSTFGEDEFRRWGMSLGFSLRTGMRQLYMLEGSELEFELEGPWSASEGSSRCLQGALTFVDPAMGGSGFLERAARELHLVARRALEHLDHADCETACYRCLKSYQNQRFHALLSWPHALPDLESVASAPPRTIPLRVRDKFNARAWKEAYAAGVGSPLELKFLRLLEAKSIRVEKQVPIKLPGMARPLTIADFAIPDKRVAIYVDGAAFHQGENLRRDRYIRGRLREAEPPWTVVELTAKDLATGLQPLAELWGEFPEAPEAEPTYEIEDPTTPPPKSAGASVEQASHVDEGEFPGYETMEEIKGGGMARCFKVRSRASGELLFLKCVGGGSQDADALQREIDVYSRLTQVDNHEHLLDVRDLVRSNGQVALVTEFADGGDLKSFLDDAGGKGLPPREALPVALEIASGLGALHEANIVHRDLKPENVLRAGSRWKLADFGIAKNRSRAAPGVTFQQAGTYGYAAPEQFEGVPADPSADIYSFGKILTYVLTGGTDPDKIRVEYSDLRKLVQRCVQYVPTSRPTIDEIGTTLKELTGG